MLKDLQIENVAVAKKLELEFDDGFSAVTGETGAGKSVMIDCLHVLTGSKTNKDAIRSGEERATVSAVFTDVPQAVSYLTGEEGDEILVTRTVTPDSRSTVRVNGRPSTVTQLKDASPNLIGITSQNETQTLIDKDEYIVLLDSFASDDAFLEKYRARYSALCAKRNEIKELRLSLKDKEMLTDILSYQIREIDSVKISSEKEVEKYLRLREKIKNIEKTAKSRALIEKALSPDNGGAVYLLNRTALAISKLSDVLPDAEELSSKLDEARYMIIDVAERASDGLSADDITDPDAQLNLIESKLSQIEKLKRKYGPTVEEIKAFRDEARSKLDALNDGEDALSRLEKEERELISSANEAAEELTEVRRAAAEKLSSEMTATLKELDMPKVRFMVEVKTRPGNDGFSGTGKDDVDMVISVNPGEPMMSLYKVASGGELSRIMLALKCSVNERSGSPTLVFDEIDVGVSGSTSERIGIMMKDLSKRAQVICVTHSPQIASLADRHYLIKKNEVGGRAESTAHEIQGEERALEIARMIGGIEITEKQIAAAKEMLARA
ncbi:MAG: DNA repair protein RecN [Clostridia bacterium]|nr:DNA repair protein RecN [Clostridia bacterium]